MIHLTLSDSYLEMMSSFIDQFTQEQDIIKRIKMVQVMEKHIHELNRRTNEILEDDQPIRNIMQYNFIKQRMDKMNKRLTWMEKSNWYQEWIDFLQNQIEYIKFSLN
jgi:hypothetical protein